MTFTLSVATGTRGSNKNTLYQRHSIIRSFDDLLQATLWDHCAGTFKNDRRNNDNFIQADGIMMDVDNCHTDEPADWLTPDKLSERLKDVAFYYIYSKSHMKDKHQTVTLKDGSKADKVTTARPRFHVYFALSETFTQAREIRVLKENLRVVVPEFDGSAKDAARFFFGVEHPQGGHFDGSLCVDEFIAISGVELPAQQAAAKGKLSEEGTSNVQEKIPVGERHGTLLQIAIESLSRYGEEKARKLLYLAAERCEPPKPVDEVNRIWDWALSKHNEFKSKFTESRKTLTLPVIEQTLQALNISLQFDVIRKELCVSDLPPDSEYLPEGYSTMNSNAKPQANSKLLPLVLESLFRDKQFRFTTEFLTRGIEAIADAHRCNPVLDLILNTHWDGQDRLGKLYHVLAIQDNPNQCSFLRKWLHQALSLASNDDGAITPEFVLVLQGKQGGGKTSFFRRLAMRPEWFREGAVIDTRDKDTIIDSTSVWLCELGELDSTLQKEQASLKSFLTSNHDSYRRPYARKHEQIERRTVFCATVNPQDVNRDTTGSRRFVYVHVDTLDKRFILQEMTPDWCAQLWRQVYDTLFTTLGRFGFYLNDDERAYSEKVNEDFNVPLPAETELLDLIDFEECYKIDPAKGLPCKIFQWYTASEIKDRLKLNRYSAAQIGKALKVLCERYPHCQRTRSNGRTLYDLPPVQDLRDD